MKKENHNEEIRATRVGGFGGSDAATVLAIAERINNNLPLTTTQKHRLLQLKGLEECPTFDSPEIQAGRDFEDRLAEVLCPRGWDRETLIKGAKHTHFRVFAHADFCDKNANAVVEAKWSRKKDINGLLATYMPQLQWYYTLGVSDVTLMCDTEDGQHTVAVERDEEMIAAIYAALDTIDGLFDNLDLTIDEADDSQLPPDVLAIKNEIAIIKRRMAADDVRLKELNSELIHWMEGNEIWKVSGGDCTVTYVLPSVTTGFDAKKFEAEHPDVYAQYKTKVTKKSAYLTIKVK